MGKLNIKGLTVAEAEVINASLGDLGVDIVDWDEGENGVVCYEVSREISKEEFLLCLRDIEMWKNGLKDRVSGFVEKEYIEVS